MKSFAILAVCAGAATAQLSGCAQMCVNNMNAIAATPEFSCSAGDTACFCTKSNWAYGIRDCSRQACSAEESAAAVAYAVGQCANAGSSGTPAALPILTSALASATGAAASAAASVTGSLASQASGIQASASSAVSGALASASSAASGAAASASSAASGAAASASSAAASALSSASGALASATNSAGSAIASATNSLASKASSAAGAASSAASSAANPPANAAVPMQTGLPVIAGAGLVAMLLL